jgi:hypothetical protein
MSDMCQMWATGLRGVKVCVGSCCVSLCVCLCVHVWRGVWGGGVSVRVYGRSFGGVCWCVYACQTVGGHARVSGLFYVYGQKTTEENKRK